MSSVLGGMMATRVVRGGQTNVISTPGESDDIYGRRERRHHIWGVCAITSSSTTWARVSRSENS